MLQNVLTPIEAYRPLTHRHKWLMQVLVSFSDRDGHCWPSLRTVAKHAGECLSWVQRNLAEMESLGYFSRRRRFGGSFIYRIAERFMPRWPTRTESGARDSAASTGRAADKNLSTGNRQGGVLPAGTEGVARKDSQAKILDSGVPVRRCAAPKAKSPELKLRLKHLLMQKLTRFLMARGRPGEMRAFYTAMMEGSLPNGDLGPDAQRLFDLTDRRMRLARWDDHTEMVAV